MFDLFLILTPLLLLPVVWLLRFIGCSFPDITFGTPSIKIIPEGASLCPKETQQFTALDENGKPVVEVTWSPNAAPNGLYTAPDPYVNATDTVTATGLEGGVTGSATVSLQHVTSVTMTPPSVTLKPGDSQLFKADPKCTPDKDVIWSSNAPSGNFTAPAIFVPADTPATVTATSKADPSVQGTATVTITPPPPSAAFLALDTTTLGSWRGVFGNAGYALAHTPANFVNPPAYLPALNVAALGPPFTFVANPPGTADPRAVQEPPPLPPTNRFAEMWHDPTLLELELAFTDFAPHTIAIYFVDWLSQGRAQDITILDNSQVPAVPLFSQNFTSFSGGQYLILKLTGKLLLRVKNTVVADAVISGIFFD